MKDEMKHRKKRRERQREGKKMRRGRMMDASEFFRVKTRGKKF